MTRGKIFLISFFTSLIVSAGVFILMYLYVVPLINANQKFSLPNVAGAKLENVKLTLEGRGLNYSLNGEENDPLVPAGNVLKQDPPAGTLVKKNDVVRLVIFVFLLVFFAILLNLIFCILKVAYLPQSVNH